MVTGAKGFAATNAARSINTTRRPSRIVKDGRKNIVDRSLEVPIKAPQDTVLGLHAHLPAVTMASSRLPSSSASGAAKISNLSINQR